VWFRDDLRDLTQDLLLSPRARQRGYFVPSTIERVVREHMAGTRNHDFRLWQLLMFEMWHRHVVDRSSAAVAAVEGAA
jgi:asparagine synthase (glutamine-hydrolysing)